jgi:hypothetical protein
VIRSVCKVWLGRDGVTYNRMVVGGLTDAEVDRLFHALSDATRRDILWRCIRGEPSVSRLADVYPMSFAARDVGLERARRTVLAARRLANEVRRVSHLVEAHSARFLRGEPLKTPLFPSFLSPVCEGLSASGYEGVQVLSRQSTLQLRLPEGRQTYAGRFDCETPR